MLDHALYCLKVGLVLVRHEDAAKDWGALGSRGLNPYSISYKTTCKQ